MAADESADKAHTRPTNIEVGSEPLTATVKYKRHAIYSPNEWLFESISSFLALSLLIAIAIIFQYMDGKPLRDWTAAVSLNAAISILTTACTTALMHGVSTLIGQSKWLHFKNRSRKLAHLEIFDGASRGVWGSLLMLAYIPWNLATIGAFVTILRLTFSPFAQQVVLIEERDVVTADNSSTFGSAHTYSKGGRGIASTSYVESIPQDPGMQTAIYQGLYGMTRAEPFKCSGACFWNEAYISLGFKAECEDVTQATLNTVVCAKPVSERMGAMITPNGMDVITRWVETASATTFALSALPLQVDQGSSRTEDLPEIARFAIYKASVDQARQSNGLDRQVNRRDHLTLLFEKAMSQVTRFSRSGVEGKILHQGRSW